MNDNNYSRREILKTLCLGSLSLLSGKYLSFKENIRHIITLSFDDGFEKSSIKTAEIYEKYDLSACINVIATAHMKSFVLPNEYHRWKAGDFQLWNELRSRGHEIMPHSYKHEDLAKIPLDDAKSLILKCLDVFSNELAGFSAKESIFNFPYNSSTPEIEEWLKTQVKAFRTGGEAINPLPYKGQFRLTCSSEGPDNIDKHLEKVIDDFLKSPSGWLIFNTHGLDDEGWGPMSSSFLDELLDRLSKIETISILPAGKALNQVISST